MGVRKVVSILDLVANIFIPLDVALFVQNWQDKHSFLLHQLPRLMIRNKQNPAICFMWNKKLASVWRKKYDMQ
jgi:hypothetical protein